MNIKLHWLRRRHPSQTKLVKGKRLAREHGSLEAGN